ELCERAARGQEGLTRSERSALSQRIDAGTWIPLRRIAPSFSGLGDEDARIAYLEAAAAAHWIDSRTQSADPGRILAALRAGPGAGARPAARRPRGGALRPGGGSGGGGGGGSPLALGASDGGARLVRDPRGLEQELRPGGLDRALGRRPPGLEAEAPAARVH